MPKTRDAFALRDFDKERIWKQRFFRFDAGKDFLQSRFFDLPSSDDSAMYDEFKSLWEYSPEVTDEEILDAYCSQAMEFPKKNEYARVRRIIEILKEISADVATYLKKICRHSKRLEKYSKVWNEIISADETLSAIDIRTRTRRIQSLLKSYSDVQRAIKKIQRTIKSSVEEIVEYDERSDRRNIFAIRLRKARYSAGLTQTQLANKLSIKRNTYAAYETARNVPDALLLASLSTELHCSTDWLLGLPP